MNKPNFRPTDGTYPNPPINTPSMQPAQGGSPLMNQLKNVWGLDWPKKPIPKAKGPSRGMKGKTGPKTSRSGVHKLGKIPKQSGGWY